MGSALMSRPAGGIRGTVRGIGAPRNPTAMLRENNRRL